ncbi:TPA: hypothetical protein ACFK18_10790 [Neisseria gonorrhoeae]
MIWFSSNCGSVCGWFCSLIGFSEKINQAQSVSDDLTESQNLRVFYAISVFFSKKGRCRLKILQTAFRF